VRRKNACVGICWKKCKYGFINFEDYFTKEKCYISNKESHNNEIKTKEKKQKEILRWKKLESITVFGTKMELEFSFINNNNKKQTPHLQLHFQFIFNYNL